MRRTPLARILVAATGALAVHSAASADCPTIDFENLAVGTAVTNQYPGVTFSFTVENATRRARIIDPVAGTSSGARALGSDQAAMGFWPGIFRMTFAEPHHTVTFRLGDYSTGQYDISTYTAGGVLIGIQHIDLEGNGQVAVYRLVTLVGSALGNISRIDIDSTMDNQPAIDDLSFEIDATPPVAELDEPDPFECACSPLQIRGTADDPDGGLFRRRLYYSADEAGPWTQISNSATPVNAGLLFSWNTAALPSGYYFVKLLAINDCGLETSVTTVVYLDNSFDTVEIRSPTALQVVGGLVTIDGTVWDQCPRDADSYRVLYGSVDAAPIGPVDPDNLTYPGVIINDPLATPNPWSTSAGDAAVDDGTWRLTVEATDSCGHVELATRDVVVDNTPPVALITSPANCEYVCGTISITGTATDDHLSHWYLEYTGGDTNAWAPIADGAGAVDAAELAEWNTDGLRLCAYTIRLRVSDTALVNGNTSNYNEYTVSINLGMAADFNRDGVVNSTDFFDFLAAYFDPPPC